MKTSRNLFLFFLMMALPIGAGEPAIYLNKNCGRLGDRLLFVAEGIWLSMMFNLPLVVESFEYSDSFAFDQQYPKLKNSPYWNYRKLPIKRASEIDPQRENILYAPDFGVPYAEERLVRYTTRSDEYQIDWKDPKFQEALARAFKPLESIPLVTPPDDHISIAVHVRTGGAVDKSYAPKALPEKFTSVSWALEKIKEIYELTGHQPTYVHIFTDSTDPKALLEGFKRRLLSPNLIVDTVVENQSKQAILTDLYSMMHFDYLICPQSSFSFMAWLLGNHKLTFRQGKTKFVQGTLIVNSEYKILG